MHVMLAHAGSDFNHAMERPKKREKRTYGVDMVLLVQSDTAAQVRAAHYAAQGNACMTGNMMLAWTCASHCNSLPLLLACTRLQFCSSCRWKPHASQAHAQPAVLQPAQQHNYNYISLTDARMPAAAAACLLTTRSSRSTGTTLCQKESIHGHPRQPQGTCTASSGDVASRQSCVPCHPTSCDPTPQSLRPPLALSAPHRAKPYVRKASTAAVLLSLCTRRTTRCG